MSPLPGPCTDVSVFIVKFVIYQHVKACQDLPCSTVVGMLPMARSLVSLSSYLDEADSKSFLMKWLFDMKFGFTCHPGSTRRVAEGERLHWRREHTGTTLGGMSKIKVSAFPVYVIN